MNSINLHHFQAPTLGPSLQVGELIIGVLAVVGYAELDGGPGHGFSPIWLHRNVTKSATTMWRSGLRGNFLRVSPAELQLSKRWKEVRPTMISSTGFFRERKKISKTRLLGARLGFSVSVVDLDSLEYNSLPLGGQSPLAKLLGKVNHDLVPPLRATGAPDAGRSGARLPRPRVQGISQRSWAVHPGETWSWHLGGITQSLGFVLENCRHTLHDRTRQNRQGRLS